MGQIDQSKIDDMPPTKRKGKREDYPNDNVFCVRKSFHNAAGERFLAGSTIPAAGLTEGETAALKRMKAIERGSK